MAFILLYFLALSSPSAARTTQDRSHSPTDDPVSSAPADRTVTTGRVRTSEGMPVPSATVRITNTSTKKVWVSWTDESGRFEFPTIPAGSYQVETNQLGFVRSIVDLQLPLSANQPIAVVLRVATLAELSARASPPRDGPNSDYRGNEGQGYARRRFGQRGGGGPLPAGVANAINQGLAGGGFSQADLTGQETNGNPGGEETIGQSNIGAQATAELSSDTSIASSSDSFLLQGTVGQGLAANRSQGPGGAPGGFGPEGLTPDAPTGFGSGPGANGGIAFRGGAGSAPGDFRGGGPGGARFAQGGLFRGGGRAAGGSRLGRQSVNRIRFSFYDRFADSAFDARPFSITGNQFPKLTNYDERIGGNLGGPLHIPHIYNGSNKTFLFANFQHEKQQAGVYNFSTVPTSAERSGDFCGLGITLYDPFSNLAGPRAPLGNGCQIPTINTAAQALLAYIPFPNVPGQTAQNYLLQATTPHNTDGVNVHILHTINAKFNLNVGYNFNSSRQDTIGSFQDIRGRQTSRNQSADIGLAHNWSSKLTENTHLNWTRSRTQNLSDNAFVNNVGGNIGIAGVATDPLDYGLPGIQFTSFTGLTDPIPSRLRNQTLRLSDALNWVNGQHTLAFGGEVRRIQLNDDSNPNPRGQFRFTGVMTNQLNSSGAPVAPLTSLTEPYYEFADFLLGLPYSTSEQFGDPNTYFRSWGFIGYAQDDWRLNKRFTLEYGIRYQAQTPPIERYNHISNLDINSSATAVAVVTPGEAGPFSGIYPRSLVRGKYDNWAPRIGFAWLPGVKPRTVARAGYSIFYNQSIYNSLAQKYLAYEPPFNQSENLYTSVTQVLTLQQGFPSQTATDHIQNTAGVSPDYRPAYAQIWTLGTETSFTQNWLLDITYVGTKGTELDLLRAPNRAPLGTSQLETQNNLRIPYATSFYYDQSGGNSIYNALQIRLVHRFTRGISFQGFYTYSKSLDNASSMGGGQAVAVQQDGNYAAERGLSSFDMRHQFRFFSTYEFPFGERSRWANRGWKEHAFSNWRLTNNMTWHTGTPLTVLLGGSAANNSGTGSNFSERANQVNNGNLGICGGSPFEFFNTGSFSSPPPGEYGNEHRGSIEGPCQFNWNLSIAKSVRFGPEQRHTVSASWEIQNLTNTPNFNGVGTTFGSITFGRITSAGSMRTMDIMVRFNF